MVPALPVPSGDALISGMQTSMHGLRSYACIRLYLAGATTREVAQTVGMSEEMVGRYTRLSSQLDEATAAIERLERKR